MKRTIILAVLIGFAILKPMQGRAAIDPKQQISIILFSGLGGAVLGLSTLSFYQQPQDHLRNIAVGGAVALIGSVVFTTVYAAKQSKAESESSLSKDATPGSPKVEPVKKNNRKGNDSNIKVEPGNSDTEDKLDEEGDDLFDDDDEGMLDNSGMQVKFLAANYGKHGITFDPWFLQINTGVNRYGEKETAVYGRIVEINF